MRGGILALLLLAVWIGSAVLLNWLDPWTESEPVTVMAAKTLGADTTLLTLGTSHVLCGVNPAMLEPGAMNIASAGSDYTTMLLILRHRLPDLPHLKTVLLEADNLCLFNIGLQRSDFSELYAWGLTRADLPLGRWARFRQAVLENPLVAPFVFSKRLTPFAWWRVKEPERKIVGPGFRVAMGHVPEFAQEGTVRIRAHEQTMSDVAATANYAALAEILRLLQQHQIRVVLISLPHLPDYNANASARWKAMFAGLLNVARDNLGPGLQWWSWDGDPAFVTGDFYDGHHLNETGAAKFSASLKARLDALESGEQAPQPGTGAADDKRRNTEIP